MSNYYLALGIERNADLKKIKQAYRICCKKYHPDSGSSKGDKQHFLRIQKAYETLSDSEKRREYDHSLSEQEQRRPERGGSREPPETIRPVRSESTAGDWHPRSSGQVRRFTGESPFGPSIFGRTPFGGTFSGFTSLLDEFFGGFVPGFFDDPFSAEKELYAELILSPAEAEVGGELPIEIPVIAECPSCRGIGNRAGGICMTCCGEGRVRRKRTFRLHIPAGIFDGAEARVSLEGIAMPDVYLNVDITVTA